MLFSKEILVQHLWEWLYLLFGENDLYMTVIGTPIIMMSVYWFLGILFLFVDLKNKPDIILAYKIQDDEKRTETVSQSWTKVVQQVLFNQTFIAIPVIATSYLIRKMNGYATNPLLPEFPVVVKHFVVFVFIVEAAFYYSHRLLHHRSLYKFYHKRHHEWKSPIGISAIYCHPVEHVLSNVLPPLLGPTILNSHITLFWLWFGLTTAYGVFVHSGYHLPFLPSPEFHDYHHQKFVENFGILGILDKWHGTDTSFRKSKNYERHFLLLNAKPAKMLIPDK